MKISVFHEKFVDRCLKRSEKHQQQTNCQSFFRLLLPLGSIDSLGISDRISLALASTLGQQPLERKIENMFDLSHKVKAKRCTVALTARPKLHS